MYESFKGVLGLIILVCFLCLCFCLFLVWDDGFSRSGTRNVILGSVVVGGVALAILLKIQFRKDKAPDFLSQFSVSILEHKGICFSPTIENRDETAVLTIWYQNRYERPASVHIVINPSMGFFLTRSKVESIALSFECGPAGFGVVRMPLPVPAKYQGKTQKFDVGAKVKYPNRRGKMLRFQEGDRVGPARINRWADQAITLAAAAGGVIAISHPASFSVRMPIGVAESIPDDAPIEVEELWQLGDPATEIAELGVPDLVG